jgi:hypothetical protein
MIPSLVDRKAFAEAFAAEFVAEFAEETFAGETSAEAAFAAVASAGLVLGNSLDRKVLGYSPCVGSGHSAVAASSACIVDVVAVAVAAVVADGDVAAAVADVVAAGDANGAVDDGLACVSERSPAPEHSVVKSQAQLREPAQSSSAQVVASNTHGLVSRSVNNTVAGRECTDHSVL